MVPKPPTGLTESPESLFRRTKRNAAYLFYLSGRQYILHILICLFVIAVHVALLSTHYLDRIDYIVLDSFFKQRPPLLTHPDIVYIDMDEQSIDAIGRWPWPRHYHAVLTHALKQWKARAIVFDVVFSEASTEFDDGALEEALRESGNVYLPVVQEQRGSENFWLHSLPKFETRAYGTGHINMSPDQDGLLRRIKPFLSSAGETYPHLALRVAYDDLNEVEKLNALKNSREDLLINWAGKWATTFTHYSYVDVIKSFEAVEHGEEPLISPEKFKGKICVIGLTAFGLADIKPNPIAPTYPGVGVHGNVINSVLTNQFVRIAPFRTNALCLILIGLLASSLFVILRNANAFIGGLLISISWVFISFFFFWKKSIWLYVANPIALILSLSAFSIVFVLIVRERERANLFKLATRDGLTGLFVIRYFRILLNQAADLTRKGKRPLCVILGDIDHFKKVNDTYGHACGDFVLKEVARIVQECVRLKRPPDERDAVGRYGGEEFIVLLNKCRLHNAAFSVAERIRKRIEEHQFMWEGKRVPVTVSLGVAMYHVDDTVPDPTVRRADAALYRAKEEGRNRTCVEPSENSAGLKTEVFTEEDSSFD